MTDCQPGSRTPVHHLAGYAGEGAEAPSPLFRSRDLRGGDGDDPRREGLPDDAVRLGVLAVVVLLADGDAVDGEHGVELRVPLLPADADDRAADDRLVLGRDGVVAGLGALRHRRERAVVAVGEDGGGRVGLALADDAGDEGQGVAEGLRRLVEQHRLGERLLLVHV